MNPDVHNFFLKGINYSIPYALIHILWMDAGDNENSIISEEIVDRYSLALTLGLH